MEIDYGTNNLKNVEQVENQISTTEQISSNINNAVEVPAVRKIVVGNVVTEQVEPDQPADVNISTRTVEKTEYMDFDFEIPKGETGPYFTPTVDDEGNLSWTNNGDLTNPETVNIRGPQGIQGPQGPAGDAGIFDDALSETSTNGVQNKVVTNALNEKLGNSGEQTISDGALTVSKTTTRESSAATMVNVQETTIHPNSIQSTISNSITNSSGNTTTMSGISINPKGMNVDGNNFSFSIKTPDSSYYTPAAAILTSKKFHFFYTPTVSMDDGTSEDLMSESQVVRTDASQSLTAADKQQAQKNITHTAWQNHATSGAQVGWYQVANLKTNGNYNIKIKQAYNYNLPEAIQLAISINHRFFTNEPFASITQLSGVKPAAFSLSKIRVRQGTDEGTTFLDVYNPDQLWNTTWVDITSDSQDVVVEPNTPFQFIGTEDNPSGYKISSLDLVTGLNVNSTVTISGTVTDLNTIYQPVNSVVTYSFGGNCAHAPKTDSGMVIQMQESTAYCTQLVIANDEKASTWRRSYRDGTWTAWIQLSGKQLILDTTSLSLNGTANFENPLSLGDTVEYIIDGEHYFRKTLRASSPTEYIDTANGSYCLPVIQQDIVQFKTFLTSLYSDHIECYWSHEIGYNTSSGFSKTYDRDTSTSIKIYKIID